MYGVCDNWLAGRSGLSRQTEDSAGAEAEKVMEVT